MFDPDTGAECPRAEFDAAGRLANGDAAVGEIVNTEPGDTFEGYYRNEEANVSKVRDGIYWSGDLAYRDADGWFFFAGRSNEWLRVDGENFAAAPVERIVLRAPGVRSAAVYAVPDDPVGDRVMVAVEVDEGSDFDLAAFDEFVQAQPDLGPKWVPSFVRIAPELPEAREHEDRQDPAAPRGVGRAGGELAPRPRRPAPTDDRRRRRRAGAPTTMSDREWM